MKNYDDLKSDIESLQQELFEAKRRKLAEAITKMKVFSEELKFIAKIMKDALVEGRN